MKTMGYVGCVISGMVMGMSAVYMMERQQRKSLNEMMIEVKESIDSMME